MYPTFSSLGECQRCKNELTELKQANSALMGCMDMDELTIRRLEEKVKAMSTVDEKLKDEQIRVLETKLKNADESNEQCFSELKEAREKLEKLQQEYAKKLAKMEMEMNILEANAVKDNNAMEKLKKELEKKDEQVKSLEEKAGKDQNIIEVLEKKLAEERTKADETVRNLHKELEQSKRNKENRVLQKKIFDAMQSAMTIKSETILKENKKLVEAERTISDLRELLEQERQINKEQKETEPKRSILEGLIMGHHVREDPATQELDQLKKVLKTKDQEIGCLQMELGKLYMKTVELEK